MPNAATCEFGGTQGIRNTGALDAAIVRPQSSYCDTLIEEAAALMESLAMNHPFLDGNERTAFHALMSSSARTAVSSIATTTKSNGSS